MSDLFENAGRPPEPPHPLIESGSLTPGIDPRDFGLPAGTAVRFERPAADLAGYLADYHVFDSQRELHDGTFTRMLPTWPVIRFILTDGPIALTLGRRDYDPMPAAAVYGTTSRASRMKTHGGVTIGAGITPLGWARLFSLPATQLRDRIAPLEALMPGCDVRRISERLRASDRGPAVKPLLDAFFRQCLGPPHPEEPALRALMALIADDTTHDLASAAAQAGIGEARLRRLSYRYFGFPPKMLLIRTRFLRSFLAAWGDDDVVDYRRISGAYHDISHFLRDANRFLGMTPKRFVGQETQYLRACIRARALVLGSRTSAIQPLHGGGDD